MLQLKHLSLLDEALAKDDQISISGIHTIRQTSQNLKWYSTKQHNLS